MKCVKNSGKDGFYETTALPLFGVWMSAAHRARCGCLQVFPMDEEELAGHGGKSGQGGTKTIIQDI